MNYAVIELGKLGLVPAVGCSHKVTCNALQFVKVLAAALRALLKVLRGVLIAAVETTAAQALKK